jgi:hypothetical protein
MQLTYLCIHKINVLKVFEVIEVEPILHPGKTVMYLKPELAALLKAGIVIGKKNILKQLNIDLFKSASGCYWLFAMLSDYFTAA